MVVGKKVANTRIRKNKGFLYYLDKQGDVSRIKRGTKSKGTKVQKVGVKKESGRLYFLDKNGDVSSITNKKKAKKKSWF